MKTTKKISHKMTGLLVSLCLCLAFVGSMGLYSTLTIQRQMEGVYQDQVIPLQQIKTISDAYAVYIVDAAHKVRDGALTPAQGLEGIKTAMQDVESKWGAYTSTNLTGEEKSLIDKFIPQQRIANQAVERLKELFLSGDRDRLKEFTANQMYQALDPLLDALTEIIDLQLAQTKVAYETSVKEAHFDEIVVITVSILSVLGAMVAGYMITHSITRALGDEPDVAVSVARRVAEGNLTVPVTLQQGSNPESLISQLKEMQASLQRIVGNVNLGAGEIATASAQIAEGNSDLASRTQQQASALEETSAAMEELTATVSQNAHSALQVSEMARNAMSVAQTGGDVMQEVIVTMRDIDESARQISSITALIDDIASQTNLLSLNAAVEAARAGEQGRGFTVVAGEVRSLAQRSADAARQIKTLIDSSMGRVQKGSELVVGAGETMNQLVTEVKNVAKLIDEISIACREQSQGVEQVGIAVTHMDEATQQNATLVEEISSAASGLNSQAQRLVQTMSAFQLPDNSKV